MLHVIFLFSTRTFLPPAAHLYPLPRVAIVPRTRCAFRLTMADDDSSSDLSSLPSLSPPPSGEDEDIELKRDNKGILKFFQKVNPPEAAEARKSPPPRKREPSPPHDYVFADNPAVAVSLHPRQSRDKTRKSAVGRAGAAWTYEACSSSSCFASDSTALCPDLWRILDRSSSNRIFNKTLPPNASNISCVSSLACC